MSKKRSNRNTNSVKRSLKRKRSGINRQDYRGGGRVRLSNGWYPGKNVGRPPPEEREEREEGEQGLVQRAIALGIDVAGIPISALGAVINAVLNRRSQEGSDVPVVDRNAPTEVTGDASRDTSGDRYDVH